MPITNLISNISGYIIIGLVVLCTVYMFAYSSIKKAYAQSGKSIDEKYDALYNIAKIIVANFDPAALDIDKAAGQVQDQANKDGLDVTVPVAKGIVKKAAKAANKPANKPAQAQKVTK